jgi:hypothetical protein
MIDLTAINILLNRVVFFRMTVEFTSAGGALPFLKQMEGTPSVLPKNPSDTFLTVSILLFYLVSSLQAKKVTHRYIFSNLRLLLCMLGSHLPVLFARRVQ